MMSNLLPKKLGEVQAFAVTGLELLDRGNEAATKAFGEEMVADMRTQLNAQLERVRERADAEKAERTTTKLRSMMEQYVGDSWDNPIELLEWSGFYLGAAGIHWSLIAGLAAGTDDDTADYSNQQAIVFADWLSVAYTRIQQGTDLL